MALLTKIQFKYGIGHPGVVLDKSEPAFDSDPSGNQSLFVGTDLGSNPIEYYSAEYINNLIGSESVTFVYVDGSLGARDVSIEYLDASVTALFIENDIQDASIIRIDGELASVVPLIEMLTTDFEVIAPTGSNKQYIIKNISTSRIDINASTGFTIDSKDTITLSKMNAMTLLDYDVSNWYII